MIKNIQTRAVLFVLFLINALCIQTPVLGTDFLTQESEWGRLQKNIVLQCENARDLFFKLVDYGQQAIGKAQSVEMLPYRYVFLVSFLGGVCSGFFLYLVSKSVKKISRYELRKKSYPVTIMRPTTFRFDSHAQSSDSASFSELL